MLTRRFVGWFPTQLYCAKRCGINSQTTEQEEVILGVGTHIVIMQEKGFIWPFIFSLFIRIDIFFKRFSDHLLMNLFWSFVKKNRTAHNLQLILQEPGTLRNKKNGKLLHFVKYPAYPSETETSLSIGCIVRWIFYPVIFDLVPFRPISLLLVKHVSSKGSDIERYHVTLQPSTFDSQNQSKLHPLSKIDRHFAPAVSLRLGSYLSKQDVTKLSLLWDLI